MKPLKRIVTVLLLLLILVQVQAQKKSSDLGIFGGGATPLSDYTQTKLLQSVHFNFGGFYRYNFNDRYAFRVNALYGTVGAKGFLDQASVEFDKRVLDISALIEFNYLEFVLGSEDHRISPYVYTGVAGMFFPGVNGGSVITPAIPLGIGAKYSLNKQWGLGIEASLRKTFSDELDNLDNPYRAVGLKKVSDNWHNNDWVSYLGLTIFYRIIHDNTECPAYDSPF